MKILVQNTKRKLRLVFLLLSFTFLFIGSSFSQDYKGIYLRGDATNYIKINEGDSIYINGSFKATEDAFIKNWGNLYITDSLVNRSSAKLFDSEAYAGTFHYVGEGTLLIKGETVSFVHFECDSTNVIITEKDLEVYGGINLKKSINLIGKIQLAKKVYDRDQVTKRGFLTEETEQNRFYNTPSDTGYIYGVDLWPDEFETVNIGLILNGTSQKDIYRYHFSYGQIADSSISKNFRIKANSSEYVDVDMYYYDNDYSGTNSNENDFKLWFSEDHYNFTKLDSSVVDTDQNFVHTTEQKLFLHQDSTTIITIADENCDDPPDLKFNSDSVYICSGAELAVQPYSFDVSNEFIWFGEKNEILEDTVVYTTDSVGTYFIMATDERGCFNIDSIKVGSKSNPEVMFSVEPISACENELFTFTNSTNPVNQNDSLSYFWILGTDTVSIDHSPVITFDSIGKLEIELVAKSKFGCVGSNVETFYVQEIPVAEFTTDNACLNQNAYFENLSQGSDISKYKWYFGDGDSTIVEDLTSNHLGTSHKYDAYGSYTVSLITEVESTGCKDTFETTVQIYPGVIAAFSGDNACLSESVVFTNESSSDGTINFYNWTFSDGQTSTEQHPVMNFTEYGPINVKLVTGMDNGCIDSVDHNIFINPLPKLSFDPSGNCEQTNILLLNTSYIDNGEITSFEWNISDGQTSSEMSPVISFSEAITYDIKLIAVSDSLCMDSLTIPITISERPLADFTVSNVCLGEQNIFINTSVGSSTYSWDFDGLGWSNSVDPSYEFKSAGDYLVTLIAESGSGCKDTISKSLTVNPVPILDLPEIISTCTGTYTADALNSPGSDYLWSTGETIQSVTFTTEGSKWVTVTNSFSCSITENFDLYLNSAANPYLGNDTIVCDMIMLDGGIADTYSWSTGETTRYISVTETNNYSVTTVDQNGCTGSDGINVTINASPTVNLGENIDACDGTPEILTASTPNGESIFWSTGETTQTISVDQTGMYTLRLENGNNCSSEDSLFIKFYDMPQEPFENDTTSCTALVLDAENLDFNYLWSNGSTDRTIIADQSGNYSVEIYNAGCSITDEISVNYTATPIVDLGEDIELCEGHLITLDAGNAGSTYDWSTGSKMQSISVMDPGEYDVLVTNSLNCYAYDDIYITQIDGPVFDIEDQTICNNELVVLDPGITAEAYEWFTDGESLSSNSTLDVNEPGIYVLVTAGANGCTYSDTITVDQNPNTILADFLVASEIYVGETVQIVDLSLPGTGEYLWYFGDGTSSSEVNPQHTYYVAEDYVITQYITNGGCSSSLSKDISVKANEKIFEEENFAISAEKEKKIKSVKLYPNPNKGRFKCEIELIEEYPMLISLYNLNGSLMYRELFKNQSHKLKEFSFGRIPAGLYILIINVEDEQRALKFVKY